MAIVGRPNVGKSSLFNWLVGRRISIVEPTAGVTRDRVSRIVESGDKTFELVDSGGMGVTDRDGLTADIERQIRIGMDEAEFILFVVDAHTGIVPLDELVVEKLRHSRKQVLCVANKCDTDRFEMQATSEFHRFGFPIVFVSAINNRNKDGLMQEMLSRLPETVEPGTVGNPVMKLAIVGKRNAGKSTFINWIAKTERVIVSEVPGTTRDSIDVRFEHNDKAFIAIDTAGVRKKKSLADSIEFYSFARAQESIRRADVVLLMLDPTSEIGKVDQQLAGYVADHYKPCIFVVNKWDLMFPLATEKMAVFLDSVFPTMTYAPKAFITAKTGKNVQAVVDLAQSLFHQTNDRVSTAEINRVLEAALLQHAPPAKKNRSGKVYFASQVHVSPPTIVLFCNDPKLFAPSYRRFLTNYFRDCLPFSEVPIRLDIRRRDSHGGPRPGIEVPQAEIGDAEYTLVET